MRMRKCRGLRTEALEPRMMLAGDVVDMSHLSDYASTEESEYVATPGDSNQDGVFDQLDIRNVLEAGKYLTGEPADWSEGDWNADGRFDQKDLVEALAAGNYLTANFAAKVVDVTKGTLGPFRPEGFPDEIADPPVFYPPTGGSHTSIRRGVDGFSYNAHTTGLPAGAYTNWIVGFPDPSLCSDGSCGGDDVFPAEGDPFVDIGQFLFYVDGGVVQENGVGNFQGRVKLGEFPNPDDEAPGIGVVLPGAWGDPTTDPSTTEYHLVVRYHGPVIPEILYEQTHTFDGGCDVYACYDPQAGVLVK